MSPETILSLAASPVLAAAMAKAWTWWTAERTAKLAAEAADAAARRDSDASKLAANAAERSDVVALLRQQLAAGEYGNFFLVRLFGYSRVLSAAEWRQIMDHARVAYGVQ